MHSEVLVTGGGGLLGSTLKILCPQFVFLTRQDGDLTDLKEVQRLFETYRPKHVLHLATQEGGVKRNISENADLLTQNVQINTNVLSVAKEFNVSRLISILSACSFQFYPDRPSHEEDLHIGLPFEGNLGFSYAKRVLDIQTKLLWKQYGCAFSTLTPATPYGPHDNWDLESSHVVASLIHKCFLAKRENKPLEVWGTGKAVRQFVFAPDLARLLVQALDSFHGPETVIVAPDSGITIADLARTIARIMKFEGPIIFKPEEPEGQRIRILQSKKFDSQFPGFNFTSLEKGLTETVKWFSEHRSRVPLAV